ncbi:MAG: glycosyltransferase family 2 protein [Candidatus Avelusimicrobium sp.]|uniref:glycosyltransferase family 2 protein n=1 Tax=Candidatus Avelusimicrobium sp. TaxID=3048833 RepID=UPI003EFE2CAF
MSKRPQISVIIPVYNVEAYLEECLQSVAAQTFAPLEVIVVNDGSSDASGDICKSFLERYPNWLYVKQSNQGVAAARKNGLERAQGEYLAFVDSDDVLSPEYFSSLWVVREQTVADLVIAPMCRFTEDKENSFGPEGTFWNERVLAGVTRARVFENFSAALALCGKLFSRDLANKAGLTFPSLRTGDDILPSIQLLAGAQTLALAPGAKYYYRQARPLSQSSSGVNRFEGLFEGFLQAKKHLVNTCRYNELAPGFERVRFICLTSFMEKFGLNKTQRALLKAHKDDLKVPLFARRNWPWKLRLRVSFLSLCLRCGLPYDKAVKFLRRLCCFR